MDYLPVGTDGNTSESSSPPSLQNLKTGSERLRTQEPLTTNAVHDDCDTMELQQHGLQALQEQSAVRDVAMFLFLVSLLSKMFFLYTSRNRPSTAHKEIHRQK